MKPQWFPQELKNYSKLHKVPSLPLGKECTVYMLNSDLFSNSVHAQWSISVCYVIPPIKFHHSSNSASPVQLNSYFCYIKLCCICGPAPQQGSSHPVPGNTSGHMAGIPYVPFPLPILLPFLAGWGIFLNISSSPRFCFCFLLNTNAKSLCAIWNRCKEAQVSPNNVWILLSFRVASLNALFSCTDKL